MATDPLADCFSRLRNGAKARHETVTIPYSKMKEEVLRLLKTEGFLGEVTISATDSGRRMKTLVAQLKYERTGTPVLESIRRISKPGHRVYGKIPGSARVREGLGFQILSTSKGIMTDRQAVEKKVGGEVLAEVY